MTPKQFDLIAELIRSRDPAKKAAKLVLVHGLSNQEAAQTMGLLKTSVSATVLRFKATADKIAKVYSLKNEGK